MEKSTKIDECLLELAKDVTEVELAVVEVEELHDEISDKIARAKKFNELKSSARRDSLPLSQQVLRSQLPMESQQNNDYLDSHQHVSELTSVSEVQLNTSQTHLSTVHDSATILQLDGVATTIVDPTMLSALLTNTVFSLPDVSLPPLTNLHPPPLISVASYTYTPTIQQQPVKLLVPDPGNLHISSVNYLGLLPTSMGYQSTIPSSKRIFALVLVCSAMTGATAVLKRHVRTLVWHKARLE